MMDKCKRICCKAWDKVKSMALEQMGRMAF